MRLVSYVPNNVLAPLISGAEADNYFMTLGATREDEAVGTLVGAYMGGLRGVVMMQTSGFALIANALASLIVPYQIPRDPPLIRHRFMRGLCTGRASALDG